MEPVNHRQTGQLVLDYITSTIISIKGWLSNPINNKLNLIFYFPD